MDLKATGMFDSALQFRAKFNFAGEGSSPSIRDKGNDGAHYLHPDVVTPQNVLFLCKQGSGISQITI